MSIMLTQLEAHLREKNIGIKQTIIEALEEGLTELQDMTEQPLCLEHVVIRPEGLWIRYLSCGQSEGDGYTIQMDAGCLVGENYG